jgi:hypothetical protein
MKKSVKTALMILAVATLAAHAPEVLAQVQVDPGAAAQTKVSGVMGFFLGLVKVVGYSLFVIAIMIAGYKIAYVEGYKASDAKGIVIGGIVFGLAATLASYLTA